MAMVLTLFFGTYAFAGKGMGHGKAMKGNGCPGCPAMQNLTPEEQQKVTAEREAFWKDTQPIRQQIDELHQQLKAEMAKTDATVEKVSPILKQISDLKAQMAQKWLQHHFNLRKIKPTLGTCFMGGYGMFHGMGCCGKPGKGPHMNPKCPYPCPYQSNPSDT